LIYFELLAYPFLFVLCICFYLGWSYYTGGRQCCRWYCERCSWSRQL